LCPLGRVLQRLLNFFGLAFLKIPRSSALVFVGKVALALVGLGCTVGLLDGTPAYGLEKYGRPLPSLEAEQETQEAKEEEAEETLLGGYFLTAGFVFNPSFTARPDNTGLVGMRHMVHLETDLYKHYFTFYTDQNFFSDRTHGWIKLSEWDTTYGITGLVEHWGWRVQYERDAPFDKNGLKQIYWDTLLTYHFQAAQDSQWWGRVLPNQNLTAYAGPGWLFYNRSYFARPDNTGVALFRYVAHFDFDVYRNLVIVFGDVNMFTDRTARSRIRPSELDWILGVALRWHSLELSVYKEQDRPIDRSGLIQGYWAIQLRFAFDWAKRRS
jgi:hypothetical protein